MSIKNIIPSKGNLQNLKNERKLAKQGYNLLDQKRSILIMELIKMIDEAVIFEQDANNALRLAYKALQLSVIATGRLQTTSIALAVNITSSIEINSRKVMGVELPKITTTFGKHGAFYSPINSSVHMDEAVDKFREALKLMGHLAEVKISIVKLANEIKKTIRKVNALDKIAIPETDKAIYFIQNHLEESERDMFVLMKKVKQNLEKKNG